MRKSVMIYTCHHKPGAFLSAGCMQPLHVGKANSYNDIGCIGDDTGDNISFKNPFYCELTAHYWVWKNTEPSDYVGFMHYRRHFNFSSEQSFPEDVWGVVNYPQFDDTYQSQFGLDDATIAQCLRDADIIVPKKWNVQLAGSKDNYDHYQRGEALHLKDYIAAIGVVNDLYPDYKPAIKEFNHAKYGYYNNMYIMRYDIFEKYSVWLFSILDVLEGRFSFNNYDIHSKRVVGHIAERLFNIFIIQQQKENAYRVKELQRVFLLNEKFNGSLKPFFLESNVPVIICFDEEYALPGAALLNSILINGSYNNNYDIVILESGVSLINKQRMKKLVAGRENISLRFFDVNAFSAYNGVRTRAHFSAATYARLFIPSLFREYQKVLFIDADAVVENDVAELFYFDIGTHLIAAVKDIVMEGFVKFETIYNSSTGEISAGDYLQGTLTMSNPDNYFQAGVLIFNISQMNIEGIFKKIMEVMSDRDYWFLDQDILNKVFYGRVYFLPMCWNVYHGNGNTESFFPNLKFSTYMCFLEARRHPKIIHYAGENKPWKNINVDFHDDFAKYINNTAWQNELISCLEVSKRHVHGHSDNLLLQTKVKRLMMPLLNVVAPRGTTRRFYISKVYYKVRRMVLR